MKQRLRDIWDFYYEGFTTMSATSRMLWLIIFIKLFIMFVILKMLFFPAELSKYDTEEQKTEHVIRSLTFQRPEYWSDTELDLR